MQLKNWLKTALMQAIIFLLMPLPGGFFAASNVVFLSPSVRFFRLPMHLVNTVNNALIFFAGSDSITVSVDDGGLKMLQITDTGENFTSK